jgi:alpha-L-fucosidase
MNGPKPALTNSGQISLGPRPIWKRYLLVNSPPRKPLINPIALLVDIVSKNGNLLLNIGPRADGSISEIQTERLRKLGDWLAVTGGSETPQL